MSCKYCNHPYKYESNTLFFCCKCSRRWEEDAVPKMTEERKQKTQALFEDQNKETGIRLLDEARKMKEAVNHPEHYGGKDNPYEVVKIAEATGLDKDAYLFNLLKYMIRKDHKGATLEDLKKGRWYLDRRIALMEGKVFHVTTPPWETKTEDQLAEKFPVPKNTVVLPEQPGVILSREELRTIAKENPIGSIPSLLLSQIELWYGMADRLWGSLNISLDQGSLYQIQGEVALESCRQFEEYNAVWNKVDVEKANN